jgi:amidase
MWPFVSSNASIIEAKRGERDRALATAGTPPTVDTTQYLRASGKQRDRILRYALFNVLDTNVATKIVARIAAGEWTSSEVLEAYIARAVFTHPKTNCLTEGVCRFFDLPV